MNQLNDYCEEEIAQLNEIIARATQFLKNVPDGQLRVSLSHNSPQYYWRTDSAQKSGTYIKRSDNALAQKLAQKDYALEILKYAEEKKQVLLTCQGHYDWDEFKNFHKQFSPHRQELIMPYVLSDDEYGEMWEQEQNNFAYDSMPYRINKDSASTTNRNELVRSKSEKILADKFHSFEIPYIYEKPLYLNSYDTFYPDFTLLNKRTRQVIYWEHFGMMDYPDYATKTVKKINIYQQNGIYVGDQLLTTYETEKIVLNSNLVDEMIRKYLL